MHGALVRLALDTWVANATSGVYLPFTVIEYDTLMFHDPTYPTRLLVPERVSYVRLTAQAVWRSNPNGMRQVVIKKTGSFFNGCGASNQPAVGGTTTDQQTSTAIIPVSPGDYFEVEAYQTSGETLPVLSATGTWFNVEVID